MCVIILSIIVPGVVILTFIVLSVLFWHEEELQNSECCYSDCHDSEQSYF
jgi:hypothetical protein